MWSKGRCFAELTPQAAEKSPVLAIASIYWMLYNISIPVVDQLFGTCTMTLSNWLMPQVASCSTFEADSMKS